MAAVRAIHHLAFAVPFERAAAFWTIQRKDGCLACERFTAFHTELIAWIYFFAAVNTKHKTSFPLIYIIDCFYYSKFTFAQLNENIFVFKKNRPWTSMTCSE
jgi:hypothetical protein